MGLWCSLLGHDFGDVVVERDREERGAEVVVTERELRECRRCGAESVVSENTEVRRLHPAEASDDADGGSDATGDDAPSGDLDAGEPTDSTPERPADETGVVSEAEASADAQEDAVIIDAETEETVAGAEDVAAEAAGPADDASPTETAEASAEPSSGDDTAEPAATEEATESTATDDAAEPTATDDAAELVEDDAAEIVESGPDDQAAPVDPEDEADVRETTGEAQSAADTDAEFVAEAADDPNADSMWGDSAVASRDEIAEGRDQGEAATAADDGWENAPDDEDQDEPMTAEEWADTTGDEAVRPEAATDESASRWPEDPRDDAAPVDDPATDSGFEFGEPVGNGSQSAPRSGIESAGPIETTGTSDDLSGALTCPACGFAVAMANSSLRAGDICPECHDGYLAEDR